MAKYEREFLVPYLQNVCALHLTQRKLQIRRSQLENEVNVLQRGKYSTKCPEYPFMESDGILFIVMGAIFLLLGLWAWSAIDNGFLSFILFLPTGGIGIWLLAIGIKHYLERKRENERKLAAYNYQLEIYHSNEEKSKKAKSRIPYLQNEIQRCRTEEGQITDLLQQAYEVNIIPGNYRNIYAAVYLYDYFSKSRADDLDMVLNTFVLEQIKAKLDIIIANQSEMILNQCMMMANQQKTLEQQESHAAMMHAKLNQIAASADDRNMYLSMIESNTAATAYFTAADYIRNI